MLDRCNTNYMDERGRYLVAVSRTDCSPRTGGGDYRPWLALRAASDAADGIAGVLSLVAGTECARQRGTTRYAFLLSGIELLLWWISSFDPACRADLRGS
jgi:hypothetical protein